MSEPGIVEISNLPTGYDWKWFHALFSEFGKVVKLYIDPEVSYGKVYFNNIQDAYKAQKELHGKPPLNLCISEPVTKDFKSGNKLLADSDNFLCNNNSNSVSPVSPTMNTHGYCPDYDDVTGSLSNQHVDIFGRVVTTLESDGGEVYVSLAELKKSGFELFQAGSLPKQGQYQQFDDERLKQFELYMKMKAAKFIARTGLTVSEDQLNRVIGKEKNNYFDLQDRIVQRDHQKKGLITITAAGGFSPNQSTPRSGTQYQSRGRTSFTDSSQNRSGNRNDNRSQQRNYQGTINQQRGQHRSNENNRQWNQQKNDNVTKDNSPSDYGNKPPLRRPYSGNSNKDSDANNTSRGRSNFNEIKPLTRTSLAMNTIQKVTVVHIENESIAWVQLSSNVNIVGDILLQTIEEAAKAKPIKPAINKVCAAMFSNIWFRAVILSTYPLKVQYLDYGNENTELLTEVRELSNKLAGIPGQALRISFEFGSQTKLEPHMEFFLYPIMQEDDGTYIVRTETSETPKSSLRKPLIPTPSTVPLVVNALPKPSTPVSPSISKESHAPALGSPIKPQTKPDAGLGGDVSQNVRKIIVEDTCDTGIFECTDFINETTFVAFAMPAFSSEQITLLETITDESQPNPSFKPKLGDLVAVNKDDEYVRGTVINNLNGKYTCALIDYGVVHSTESVRPLPDKFKDIPEFSCECVTDADILRELVDAKSSNMTLQIKLPSVLNIKLESGREFVIQASRWDPFKSSPLAIQKSVDKAQAIFNKKPSTPVSPSISKESHAPALGSPIKPQTKSDAGLGGDVSQNVRKMIVEDTCDTGIFECTDFINETTFVAFAMPAFSSEQITLLETITDESQPNPSFKPKLGDLVAVNRDDEYVRGTVINNLNGKYTCALIDYGVVHSTESVRPLPDKFKDIPEFSCECVTDADILRELVDAKSSNMTLQIKLPSVLNIKLESGREFVIQASRWDPFKSSPLAIQKSVDKAQAIFNNRPSSRKLNSNDVVRIVAEQDGCLLVRTRECNTLLTEVNQELRDFKGESFKKQPEIGYLAVCSYNDGNWYRVIVASISGANATVEYIDYGNYDRVKLTELRAINEKLATMDSTLIKISLKGFTGGKFSPKALEFLTESSEKKDKFIVGAAGGNDAYELLTADKCVLLEKLVAMDKPRSTTPIRNEATTPAVIKPVETPPAPQKSSSTIKWGDLPVTKFENGMNKVMCLFAGNVAEGCVTFCLQSADVFALIETLSNKIMEYVEADSTPYHPEKLEVCLAKFEDAWYRAAVIHITSDKYGLYYIDYGNSHTVTANDIRKMPQALAKIQSAAVYCQLDGVLKPSNESVDEPLLTKLQAEVVECQIYDINVLGQKENLFIITIPDLYECWKKEGLL